MKTVLEALESLLSIVPDKMIVDKFAEEQYYKRFPREEIESGTWHAYDNYTVTSHDSLYIKYKWGAGDMEHSGGFRVILE